MYKCGGIAMSESEIGGTGVPPVFLIISHPEMIYF